MWAEGMLAVFGCYVFFGIMALHSGWLGSPPSVGETAFVVMVAWPLAAASATWQFLVSALRAQLTESMIVLSLLTIFVLAWQVEHLRTELRQVRSELRDAKQNQSRNL